MRQALIILLVVATFGILVPVYKGFALLDPRIISAYASLALLFVAPASAELAAKQPPGTLPAVLLNRIGFVVIYGWGLTVLILFTALVTLNLLNWRGVLIVPPWSLSSALLVFSLTGSIAVATASALLARHFSAAGVKSILRGVFLLVLLVLVFSSRVLPESWQFVISDHMTRRAIARLAWEGAGVAAVIAGLLVVALLKKPAPVAT